MRHSGEQIEDPRQMSANFLPGGRVDVRGTPMKTILAAISKVPENMIDGLGWLSSERYHVICKANPKSTGPEGQVRYRAVAEKAD